MKIWKMLILGLIVWTVPFLLGFLLFPLVDTNLMLFKTIMIVTGSLTGMICIIIYFRRIDFLYWKNGVILGIIWFSINFLLDIVFLVLMFQTPFVEYLFDTGLRYLNILIMALGAGWLLEKKIS